MLGREEGVGEGSGMGLISARQRGIEELIRQVKQNSLGIPPLPFFPGSETLVKLRGPQFPNN